MGKETTIGSTALPSHGKLTASPTRKGHRFGVTLSARSPTGMLRIAMVTTFYPPYSFGGDGAYVRRMAHALARKGHEVEVIVDAEAFEFLSGESCLKPLPEPERVKVHFLRSGFGRLSCLATQQLGRPVFNGKKIERILGDRFDVIHYHNISLVGGPGILSYGNAVKIYTTHEHWLVCQSHILWRHNRELCDRRECIRCAIAHKRPPQLWRHTSLLKKKCEHIDVFISPSQSCVDNHRRFGFDFPMTVMPSFLPDSEEDESEIGPVVPQPDRPYFLFVGRLARIKGIQDVIPLFNDDNPTDLLIAGSGEDEVYLRNLAFGRKTVKFLGHCAAGQLRELYRNATALITPSLCYEVAPLVVLEAFREGTPIIARKLGPFPELVKLSNGGILFSNESELKEGMRRLLEEQGLRESLGGAAKKAFQEVWSEEVGVSNYLNLIRELVENKGRRNSNESKWKNHE